MVIADYHMQRKSPSQREEPIVSRLERLDPLAALRRLEHDVSYGRYLRYQWDHSPTRSRGTKKYTWQ